MNKQDLKQSWGKYCDTDKLVTDMIELLKKYGDIDRLRRALNHSSESVTMIYAMADRQLEAKNKRRRNASGRRLS